MQVSHGIFIIAGLFVLLLPLPVAKAQGAVDYRFLSVLDTAGKPVVDARVETNTSTHQTDEKGSVEKLPVEFGDYNTLSLRISKPGYVTYEDKSFFGRDRYYLIPAENSQYNIYGPFRIELLRAPVTAAERKAVARELQKRELFEAIRQGDVLTVRRLLQAGVDANARDEFGIPALLWAAKTGDLKIINSLLASGADVRSNGTPGGRVLLYYLYYAHRNVIDYEVVRKLLKAGADVNSADRYGRSALIFAKEIGDAKLTTTLESAGAKHK
ncbi:MAG: ankyrin repeat protein [Acidobacteria bacterium]|nr:ankyrin repeat protein [Acidobacteriota bacterium]